MGKYYIILSSLLITLTSCYDKQSEPINKDFAYEDSLIFINTLIEDNDELSVIFKKIESSQPLSDNDLNLLIKIVDWEQLAPKLIKYDIGVPNFNLDNVAKAVGRNTPEKTNAAYEAWMKGIEKVAFENGFGRFPEGVPDEIKPMYEMIYRKIKEKVDQHLLDYYPEIHQQIFPQKLKTKE